MNAAPVQHYTASDRWAQGSLKYLLRKHGQARFYDFLKGFKREDPTDFGPLVAICHRHFGKTTASVIYGFSRCLKTPGTNVIFLSPKENQCDRNLRQPLSIIARACPEGIHLSWSGRICTITNDSWPEGSPPSTFQYLGSDGKGVQSAGQHIRGIGAVNVIIVDEARDCVGFDDLVQDVLSFCFQKQVDPLLLFITTPPKSLDHPLVRSGGWLERAQRDGRYFISRADTNEDFSIADRRSILKACGGDEQSDFWRREALCELIQDSQHATIRDYMLMQPTVELEAYKRPEWFFPLLVMDTGYARDPSALVAGYVDYDKQCLVIESARTLKKKNTSELKAEVEEIISRVWPELPPHPIRCYADTGPMTIADFWAEHRIRFFPADTYDFSGSLQRLNTIFAEGRVRILPDAQVLRYQCLTGILDNMGKLQRTETLGHQDATAALIYMAKMAPWSERPTPIVQPVSREGVFVPAGTPPIVQVPSVPTAASKPGKVLPPAPAYILPEELWTTRIRRRPMSGSYR